MNSNKQLFKITYISILDGAKHTYMNIGFESYERAEREKDLLEKEYKKRWSEYSDDEIREMYINGTKMYISMFGRDFKVEPIKLRNYL